MIPSPQGEGLNPISLASLGTPSLPSSYSSVAGAFIPSEAAADLVWSLSHRLGAPRFELGTSCLPRAEPMNRGGEI